MAQRVSRRRFLGQGGSLAVAMTTLGPGALAFAPSFDVVVKGGTILDGTGGPAWKADVGIVGDTIAAVGSIDPAQGRRAIDASGMYVAPGFVDIHSHSDRSILAYPGDESRAYQGVTTEVVGNCGSSAAPLGGPEADADRKELAEDGVRADWSDVASFCKRVEETGISVNQALLLGQGTIRTNAVGNVDRPLTADELATVLRAVEDGMEQGAYGLSTGLEYTPGLYTPTAEIVDMARIVARHGGLYASHIRNEEAMLLEAVDEAVNIGRAAGVRVQVSHLKAAGKGNWGKQRAAIDLLESARRVGVQVLADAYPYTAYSTGLTILLEAWAREGTSADLVRRLRDANDRARMRKELIAHIRNEPGDYDLIVISSVTTEKNKAVIGKNLAQIADLWKVEPVDAYLKLIEEEAGSVSYVGHGMSEANVEMVLSHPLVMISSDGVAMAPTGKAAESRPHPRSYGAFARALAYYTRERKLFDLPTAVKKMTSMPADQIGLSDRGRVAKGKRADLVVFDAAKVTDEATFETPHRYASGIPYVLVNGVAVIDAGKHTGARSGRMLRKG
jgi:N-acyl-D-amino-acid deacylase